jgi:transposase-like protein
MGAIGMGNSYTDSFKESMVKKMTGPDAKNATALAEEVGVHQSTLSRWLRDCGRFGSTGDRMNTKKRPQNWTAEEKMEAVITYNAMDEQEQGLYLRGHGLYSVDIERWREEMLQALSKKPKQRDPKDRRIRELEGELRRKEKALAETAALLVLKKKAQAIWGDSEDGK